MHLFNIFSNKFKNLLPKDEEVNYYGPILDKAESDYYLLRLLENIAWMPDEANIMGKHILTKREVAWYADLPFEYTYSRITKYALPWTQELLNLKTIVEQVSNEQFNSCFLNLYHNGSEGMAWRRTKVFI